MDLMNAVDDVTSAMESVVTELTKTRNESARSTMMEYHFDESNKDGEGDDDVWNGDENSTRVKMKVMSNKGAIYSNANAQVSVY